MSKIFLIFLIFFSSIINCNKEEKKEKPIAINGIIDLTKNPFKEKDYFVILRDEDNEEPIKLNGKWEFYWKHIPEIKNGKFNFNPADLDTYMEVPSIWNDYINKHTGENYESQGYAVYRLKVEVKEKTPLAIRIPFLSTSYRFYIDEDMVVENGKFSQNKETSFPETSINYVFFTPENREFYLTFFICNYYHNDGGFWSSIHLGPIQSLINLRTKNIAVDLFVSGILFIMGIYHLSFFYLQRNQKSALYFSIFCLLLALRTIVTGENYLKTIFPQISYQFNMVMVYITIYSGAFIFNQFVASLYPTESFGFIKRTIDYSMIFLILTVILLPTIYFTKTLLTFQIITIFSLLYTIYIFIKAIKNKRVGARSFLTGFTFFSCFVLNDIFFANNIINTGYYLTHGFIIFIFSQSFVLTKWFSNAFKQVKELSENLELKVKERTQELSITTDKLENSLIKAYDLNAMIQMVVDAEDIDDMLSKIFRLFSEKYNLTCFVLYIDNGEGFLYLYKLHDDIITKYNPNYTKVLEKNLLEINNKYCINGTCFRTKKSFFAKRIRIPHPYPPEEENIKEGDIRCLYIVPLIYNKQSFGTVTFATNQGNKFKNIDRQEKEEIENFMKLISPSIYQSLQKRETEKAYKELKKTQKQLIEAEKMASLGNLISGIAHEINNPIAIIKSQVEFLKNNNCFDLNQVANFLNSLNEIEKDYFFEIAEKCLNNKDFYNTRDSRKIKKEIQIELEKFITDEKKIKKISDQLLEIKLLPPYEQYFSNVKEENIENFIFTISKFKTQINHIDNIEIAVEKSSRIIFALRIFLNTNIFFHKQKFNLIETLERTLYIYNNYIIGKIEIIKDYQDDLDYFGIKENIIQVLNSILFNAIQAVQKTEKKIKIEIKRLNNLSSDLLNMYSSNANYDNNDSWIIISITDSGEGIKKENINKIFTPFFTTKGLGEGVGLGLYISKKIMEEHDGIIFFSSQPGETKFVIVLPIK